MASIATYHVEDPMAPLAMKELSAPQHGSPATGEAIRLAARSGAYTTPTSGIAATYVQANLIVLPNRYASDFRLLCKRNPVPCPLLAESRTVGSWEQLTSNIPGVGGERLANDLDLRRDIPRYMVYQDGTQVRSHCADVCKDWSEDHSAFLIGCSFSFEAALADAGLVPAHMAYNRNVPMYATTIPLCSAGVFKQSTYVVSMRFYRRKDVERVRDITRPYVATHGEPLDWDWCALERLGIQDLDKPEYGDSPVGSDGLPVRRSAQSFSNDGDDLVPVFWGCGVTPQQAVMQSGLKGTVIGHAPGHMLVLDLRDWDILAS
ncbi:uncharacterized protein AB675_10517 [Cyphellophora attinorum]|uniref:Hydro-lyase n=1 Tax=Cyphellophora attinorum TaxID=1664694 RepID=A0A0N1GYT7_9EURO|nr:uncharacterized protein AB675_10517 [Phialophora attinorum]KPI35955.1 hypothetical protein AB675_10517 [Phialophora attinorum]